MKKIGIVSFWRNNYGSALQSYALKYTLQKMEYHVDILNERYFGIFKYYHYILKKINIIISFFKSFEAISYFFKLKYGKKKKKSYLSKEASEKIEFFTKVYLQPIECSYKMLKKYAESENVEKIIAGSDQIWNCSNGIISPYYFLQFVPKSKRIAVSPSFGSSTVPKFLQKRLSKILLDFSFISVRENEGVKIIQELTGKNVKRLADPVVLLTDEEWREFYSYKRYIKEPYIFIHFLDKPNFVAIDIIKNIRKKTNMTIVCFSYMHAIFEEIEGVMYVSGTPQEYISYIDNAEAVYTDSFHTTMFSIIMNSKFFTFNREYQQVPSQKSRLITLLKLYNYEDHMINDKQSYEKICNKENHNIFFKLESERNNLKDYLSSVLKSKKIKKNEISLKKKDDCVGCGACLAVCSKNAIEKSIQKEGYWIPSINKEKCILCRTCEKVCFSKPTYIDKLKKDQKKAYVAYNVNENIRKKSASGGAYSAIAEYILKNNGVVCGAELSFIKGIATVKHILVDNIEDLHRVIGSKYVESDCSECYPKILAMLKNNKKVLFGGTSCQVVALYNYLNGKYLENLYTVDLVCHGVPGINLFNDYILSIENKYKAQIIDFKFRTKINNEIQYQEMITLEKNGKKFKITIPSKESSYYKLFLLGESYRESCYSCEYSSIDKPADITLGDYFELSIDYPTLYKEKQNCKIDGVSCMLINSSKGSDIVDQLDLISKNLVDIEIVQRSHLQLCKPMRYSELRYKIFNIYQKYGYQGINHYFKINNFIFYFPRIIKHRLINREKEKK